MAGRGLSGDQASPHHPLLQLLLLPEMPGRIGTRVVEDEVRRSGSLSKALLPETLSKSLALPSNRASADQAREACQLLLLAGDYGILLPAHAYDQVWKGWRGGEGGG
jgi:hypothetical protein